MVVTGCPGHGLDIPHGMPSGAHGVALTAPMTCLDGPHGIPLVPTGCP